MLNKKTSVYLIAGSEQYLKKEKLDEIKATFLEGDSTAFNFNIFYATAAPIKDVLECLRTLPLPGQKRVILLRQVEELSIADQELILAYVKTPAKQNLLILDTSEINLNQSFFREICKFAQVVFCLPLRDRKLFTWVKLQAQTRGKKVIEDKAVQLLIDNLGSNLQLLISALDALVCYVGERPEIKVEDIEKLVGPDMVATAFELFDAINSKDREKAFCILDSLFKDGINSAQILGALAHKFIAEKGRGDAMFLRCGLENLQQTDSDIKNGRQQQRLALEILAAKLMNTAGSQVYR